MTRQDFLNGVEFTINGNRNYRFDGEADDCTNGMIARVYRDEGIEIDYKLEVNISKVTDKRVYYYTYVMGRLIEGSIDFTDMETPTNI